MRTATLLVVATCVVTGLAQRTCAPQVREEGAAVGKTVNLDGIQTYISPPTGQSSNATAILYLTDIFGIPLLQQRLLADSMAAANYLVVMPDLFAGESLDPNTFGKPNANPGFNMTAWSAKHGPASVDAIIEKTIRSMRSSMGVKKIAGVGYCFGGKYVPRFLAKGKGLDAGFIAHPSSLTDEEIGGVAGPLTFGLADGDKGFSAARRTAAAQILQNNNVTYEVNLYSNVEHGFAVRTDVSIKQKRYAKQSAFAQAIRWFDVWVKDVENGYPFH